MKELILKNGEVCLLDDEDYEMVKEYKWSFNRTKNRVLRYICNSNITGVKTKVIRLERVIMSLDDSQVLIIYKDGNKLNLQKENLYKKKREQIPSTSHTLRNNIGKAKSGMKGVRIRRGHYTCQIRKDKKLYNIGSFKSLEEAAEAYDDVAWEFFKDPYLLNFPERKNG